MVIFLKLKTKKPDILVRFYFYCYGLSKKKCNDNTVRNNKNKTQWEKNQQQRTKHTSCQWVQSTQQNAVSCKIPSISTDGFEGEGLVGVQKLSRNFLEIADPRH